MGISNQASGLKPGVCTSTTRPTTPYNGQVIYETDTKQTLVYQGSAWVMLTDADTPPGLECITPSSVSGTGVTLGTNNISFSAATSITLEGVFSSTYRNYLVKWDALFSAGSSTLNLQFKTAATTATSNYQFSTMFISSGNPTGSTTTAQPSLRVGANDASTYAALEINVYSPNIALPTRTISAFNRNNGLIVENSWGCQTDSTQFTGLVLTVNSGNMTGAMQIYGYRNS